MCLFVFVCFVICLFAALLYVDCGCVCVCFVMSVRGDARVGALLRYSLFLMRYTFRCLGVCIVALVCLYVALTVCFCVCLHGYMFSC